jgi:radical SAM superfamily enzyme YgiQ (UPF0313 family)
MHVLLIVPTFNYTGVYPTFLSNSDLPMGFPYLAAALKHAGHEVRGVNPNNAPGFASAIDMLKAKLAQAFDDYTPDLIGVGGLCTDYRFLTDAINLIRQRLPQVPIVCGGGIITNDAEFAFRTLKPDFCVVGEGEEILVQLTDALEGGQDWFDHIPNLGYWQNGKACFTPFNFDYGNLDERVFPDYEPFGLTEMLDTFSLATRQQYRYTRPDPRPMTIITARSCPFKCTFCVHQLGIKYRARSIENIISEIVQLYDRYHFNILLILDELFANNKRRFTDFCLALEHLRQKHNMDFDWQFQTHASAALGPEELNLAKRVGCTYFSYGIESASPRVLASMNKKTRPDQISGAIAIASQVGIGFGGNFIFGDPAETHETFFESMEFIFNHCMDIHTNFGIVCPYPGSKLFDYCREKSIIRDKQRFYESIDKYITNMTAMPDEFWSSWIVKFCGIINRLSFLEETTAFRFENESLDPDNPMQGNGVFVWRIWAHCPHCHRDVQYREHFHLHLIETNKASFVTGCPSCHKRIRINVHADAGKRTMGLPVLNKKIFCDGRREQPEAIRQHVYQTFKEHLTTLIRNKTLN